jgi:hypothetical protein
LTPSSDVSGCDTPLLADSLLPSERVHQAEFDASRRIRARQATVQNSGNLGGRLRWLRAERSLRQIVALAPGLSVSRLQQLEAEPRPNPSLSVLISLQRAFGCVTLDELVGPLLSEAPSDLNVARDGQYSL